MYKPAVMLAVFGGACLMHICLLFSTFHHRQKNFSSLRGTLGVTYKIIFSKSNHKLEIEEVEAPGGDGVEAAFHKPKPLSLFDMKQHIELIDKIKSQPEHKMNLNPNELITATISDSEKAIAEKHEKLAKEKEKLLAMELELEKVSKNHPAQSSSNAFSLPGVNLVLKEIETGMKLHPDLVADARKIHESGKFRRSPGSENVGIFMNSHPSVLGKYIFFPSIAEVIISEKLSGRPLPKSLEQQVAYVMKIHPTILDKVINHPELVGNVQRHPELKGKLKNFDFRKSIAARSHQSFLHTVI